MIYIRKKPKQFGANKQIEGSYEVNQKAILIEDLATDGGSKVNFIKALRNAKLNVSDIFVIIYYNIFDITKTPLADLKVKIHSLCTWADIIKIISEKKIFSNQEIKNLKIFLQNPEEWRRKNG